MGAMESRPTRNARKSVSFRSSTRTMWGQRQQDVSLLRFVVRVCEQPADDRQIDQAWDAVKHTAFAIADEPSQHVGLAVPQANDGADLAIGEGGSPHILSRDALTATRSVSDTSSS
jgi:hypothetical protein